MIRSMLATAALTAPLFVALTGSPPADLSSAAGCPDVLNASPVVIFDVSGYTLAGPLHTHLVVYDNGLAAFSSASGLPGPSQSSCQFEFLPPTEALGLLAELRDANAFDLCDDDLPVADLPLTTVTVMTPGTDAKAHSFSYWIPTTPRHQQVAQAIADFLDEHFTRS